MSQNPMLEALKNKKAHGIDVTLIMAGPHNTEDPMAMDEDERKELDLAPDATPIGEEQDKKDEALGKAGHHDNMMPGAEQINHPDAKQDKMLIEEELAKAHMGKRSLAHHGMMKKHKE